MHHKKKTLRNLTQPTTFYQALEAILNLDAHHLPTILDMGGAYLNGRRHKEPEHLVQNGDLVEVYYRLPIEHAFLEYKDEYIHCENKQILIANKPAGFPTQGRRDCDKVGFYECLKDNLKGYLGLHHRLDQDTSGLILFTRNREKNKTVARLFQEKRIQKTYVTILEGAWRWKEKVQIVDAPLGPKKTATGTKQVVHQKGKHAQTEFELIDEHNQQCLVLARPKTGRTHQIRVHAQHIGLPLLGDKLYGNRSELNHFFLHASSLKWPKQKDLAAGDFQSHPHWPDFPHFNQTWSDYAS